MKVNIVCRTIKTSRADGVLPRFAQALADETGWSLSQAPITGVDLNYWICYITYAQYHSDWHFTPVAGWFTHYEQGTQFKEFWWELAANNLDLRLTSADMYRKMLEPFGMTKMVTPPIDQYAFSIADKAEHDKPVVGVSGFVHPGGRKGEKLVARLAGSKLGRKIEMKGSGRGWPVPTVERRISKLPAFYNSLDVFLCSSLMEGVPAPPLEALACGIPVVIPRGVGLLDSLPDHEGIHRYTRGDYDDMERAVREALGAGSVNRESLRATVKPFTAKSWAKTHEEAFSALLDSAAPIYAESDRHGARGAFYVAFGGPARKCARASMASFKQHNPGVRVAVVSDRAIGPEDRFIEGKDEDIGGRAAKTQIYDLAPQGWQYVMYLDADTEVVDSGEFLFQVLQDGWDMVICKNPGKYHIASKMVRSDNKDECEATFDVLGTSELIQLNGGVFAFQRNERTAAFFRCWHEEWHRWGKRDQAALLRALWKHPIRLYVLGNEWNTITRYDPPEKAAFLLHYPMTARRWRGKVRGRSDSQEAWARVRAWEKGNG